MRSPLPPSIWCWCPGTNDVGSPCRHPAEVIHETILQSTSGPVKHVWTLCVREHRFFLPAEMVVLMD